MKTYTYDTEITPTAEEYVAILKRLELLLSRSTYDTFRRHDKQERIDRIRQRYHPGLQRSLKEHESTTVHTPELSITRNLTRIICEQAAADWENGDIDKAEKQIVLLDKLYYKMLHNRDQFYLQPDVYS